MVISHNLNAMNAHRQMKTNTTNTGKAIEKLSSGLRINRAGDDAAGLAISEKMRSQIRGLNQGSTNAQDGISLVQTTEGALTETHSMLQRLKTLAVQSSNGTYTDSDRALIQKEVDQLTTEITRIASQTEFNGLNVLSKDGQKVKFQVGNKDGQTISSHIICLSISKLFISLIIESLFFKKEEISSSLLTFSTILNDVSLYSLSNSFILIPSILSYFIGNMKIKNFVVIVKKLNYFQA